MRRFRSVSNGATISLCVFHRGRVPRGIRTAVDATKLPRVAIVIDVSLEAGHFHGQGHREQRRVSSVQIRKSRAFPSERLLGGACRARTGDLRLAKPALSQLS